MRPTSSAFLPAHEYTRALEPEDVRVDLVVDDALGLRAELSDLVSGAGQRFGFTVRSTRSSVPDALAEADPVPVLRHLIVVADRDFDDHLVERAAHLLTSTYHSVDLVFGYPTAASSAAAARRITALKGRLADRVNFPRPDHVTGRGWHVVSNRKVAEEAASNTVRVKYRPCRVAERLPPGWVQRVWPYFRVAARTFCAQRLYHRGTSDGYLAVRTPEGLAITATKTYKDRIHPGRIVLVHGYAEDTNTVTYTGPVLPSTEAVELSIVAHRLPELTSFVHTHGSDLFVRNPRFAGLHRIGRALSGLPATGHALASAMAGRDRGLIILEEHGELFFHAAPEGETISAMISAACDAVRAGRDLAPGLLVTP
jgi:hypothetical protein